MQDSFSEAMVSNFLSLAQLFQGEHVPLSQVTFTECHDSQNARFFAIHVKSHHFAKLWEETYAGKHAFGHRHC